MTTFLFDNDGGWADISLTVEELACASHTDVHWIICHVNDNHLALREGAPASWRFDSADLRRARHLAAAERMFEVNGDAAAFIADLLDEIRRLRTAAQPPGAPAG